MVFDIGYLHVKVREWKVGEGRSRGLLLKDGIVRGGKREGRGREEREKKGRGVACPNNKKIVPALLASKHQFGRPVKCYRCHGRIHHKADAVKQQIPKPRPLHASRTLNRPVWVINSL